MTSAEDPGARGEVRTFHNLGKSEVVATLPDPWLAQVPTV